jgi:hypothetical protein
VQGRAQGPYDVGPPPPGDMGYGAGGYAVC